MSNISPAVAVATKLPPTPETAKFKPASFTTVASPLPFVVTPTVPSTAREPKLIRPLPASVVAVKLPVTVTVPLSVIPAVAPLVSVKLPPTVAAAISSVVVPLSMVA